jgi:hypothetical protein
MLPLARMFVLFLAAVEHLINFHHARQREGVALHGGTPAMAHKPASPVVATGVFAENKAMNLVRANSFLTCQDQECYLNQ